jgi:uncharacterized protein YndB with AHSA1/START domain
MAAEFTRSIYIGAPAEEVWEWLVEPEKMREYALSHVVKRPRAAGEPIEYAGKLAGHVVIAGTILELVEGRRLVHTFQFQFEPLEEPSRVSFELLRYGDRMCCLQLRHDQLDPESQTYSGISTSWEVFLSSLKTIAETGNPLPWPGRTVGPRE